MYVHMYVCILSIPSASFLDTSAEAVTDTSVAEEQEGLDLEEILKEKKYSWKARLFVANIAGMNMSTFRDLFSKYGELRDVHVNKEKGFGFLKLVSY